MTDVTRDDDGGIAHTVFSGLVPSPEAFLGSQADASIRAPRNARSTVPILLVGSLAMTMTGAIPAVAAKPEAKPGGEVTEVGSAQRPTMLANVQTSRTELHRARSGTVPAPASYRVVAGDTVSGIAEKFGLSTPAVLALNGLSWSSLIFPGQEIALTNSGVSQSNNPVSVPPAGSGTYSIVAGDTIHDIADRFGVSMLSVLTANSLGWSSIIYPGQVVLIPGLVRDTEVPPDASTHAPQPTRSETSTDAAGNPVELVADPSVPAPGPAPAPEGAADPTPPTSSAPPPLPAPAPAPAPIASGSYTVRSGDTVSGIATMYGISTQSLLDANGLSRASVIYPGNVLRIPGAATPISGGGNATSMNDEMRSNAAVIVQVGRELGVPDYGIVIALATAMQESSLRNLTWGDRDSVGLFQQRPSSGWGTVEQLTSPSYAARLFFGGPTNPNVGRTRGLLDIPGWQSLSLTRAAQAVQISAYPDAYAKWETSARDWFAQLS